MALAAAHYLALMSVCSLPLTCTNLSQGKNDEHINVCPRKVI